MYTINILKLIIEADLNIQSLFLSELLDSRVLQERLRIGGTEKTQINKAISIRNKYKLPFWDALCLTFFSNPKYSSNLLKETIFHNSNNLIKEIKRSEIDNIEKHTESINKYAVLSKIVLSNGHIFHLPFIDFHCSINTYNEELVRDVIKILDIGSGFLLNSGESYHFIGNKYFPENQFPIYMGKLLLFSPIIDRAWIAHQLIEGFCALRITKKNGSEPKFILKIE